MLNNDIRQHLSEPMKIDLQQFYGMDKVVGFHGGPVAVRVHEAQDAHIQHSPHRYYISVDLKMREIDGLRGDFWSGCTKAEATREAARLAKEIHVCVAALRATEDAEISGKALLIERHNARLQSLVGKYHCEVVS